MINNKYFIFYILIIATSVQCFSQKEWTLEKCIEYAKENNLMIKEQAINTSLLEADYKQSYYNITPRLTGYGQHSYNYGKTVDRYTNEFATTRVLSEDFYVSGRFDIFNGLQNLNTIKKRKLDLQASQYDKQQVMEDITLEVASAFLDILYFTENLEITKNQHQISLSQLRKTKVLVEGGKLAKKDLLQIQSQAATEEVNMIRAQNSFDIAVLRLKNLLELDTVENFTINKPVISIGEYGEITYSVQDIYEQALTSKPGIKSAETKIKSAEKNLDIQRGKRYPQLEVTGYLATGYSGASKRITETGDYEKIPYSQQIEDNFSKSFGFQLTIPIFNRWHTQTAIKKAKVEMLRSENQLEQQKNAMQKIIKEAYADAIAAFKEYNAAKKSLDASKEAFKYTAQKFNLGAASSIEYNEAKNNLNNAQAQLLQSKFNYVFKVKILDFYNNKPLSL